MTTARPKKNGSEPTINNTATMNPHNAIVRGLAMTTRIEVNSATAAPTSRSSNNGKETAPIVRASTANKKPIPVPTTIRCHPADVVNTPSTN